MRIIQMFVFIGLYSLSQSRNRFMPNLPMGEYRFVYHRVYHCESSKNHSIQLHLYFSKKTSTITELKGNITAAVPFTDSLTLDINFSSWGSTGGWVPNAYIIVTKKACSNLKNLLGKAWNKSIKAFNIPTDSCPLPVGIYTTSGFDLKNLEELNFPKVFFYGKYRLSIHFKDIDNKVVGCEVLEMSFIRPWETPIY